MIKGQADAMIDQIGRDDTHICSESQDLPSFYPLRNGQFNTSLSTLNERHDPIGARTDITPEHIGRSGQRSQEDHTYQSHLLSCGSVRREHLTFGQYMYALGTLASLLRSRSLQQIDRMNDD